MPEAADGQARVSSAAGLAGAGLLGAAGDQAVASSPVGPTGVLGAAGDQASVSSTVELFAADAEAPGPDVEGLAGRASVGRGPDGYGAVG
ncbi:hypothetical protein [Streptomyces sp. NBC_00989]|uniref:hypothetical protein n=1 Tax=Streptomyces sp. NBC_00989 TaxID=2903705 RepID=UPI00386BF8F5|nr:hypothetical protein OG714_40805 [Streptomyces sp. NBC_00989]